MRKPITLMTRSMPALLASCVLATGLSACGGGDGIPGNAVARVGETAITKAELGHWMSTLTGGDFYEVAREHTVPAGLVSEPPNYSACVASLEAAAASARSGQQTLTSAAPKATAAQFLTKCRQLYIALRLQAVAYLVNARWTIGVYTDLGVRTSDAEVMHTLEEIKAAEFPKPGQFERYLASNRRTLADELLVVKLDVLSQKLDQRAHREGTKAALREFSEAGRRWTAKTECRAGYVVPHCRQFRKWRTIAADPAVLLEQVATVTGIPCVNKEACG